MPLMFSGESGGAKELRSVVQIILKSKRVSGPLANRLPPGILAMLLTDYSIDPSDEEMYLLLTASEYVLAQRDRAWFGAEISSPFGWTATVGDSLWASFLHLRDAIGVGRHGLIRMQTADHNDGILGQFRAQNASLPNHTVAVKSGESVMNGALASYALNQYAEALKLVGGQPQRVAEVLKLASGQRAAVARAWSECPAGAHAGVGGWYLRAWLGDDEMGWRGQCGGPALPGQPKGGSMWTETQSWALLGGVPDLVHNRTDGLLETIEKLARQPSPIGALNVPPSPMEDVGTSYGGVWQCGNQALIQALGKYGRRSVFDEWTKSMLGTHAEVYPGIHFGVTSGPDVVNSVLSTWPGSTRCEYQSPEGLDGRPPHGGCNELSFPLLNSWQHSVPLMGVAALVGAEFTSTSLILAPIMESHAAFNVSTNLFGVARARLGDCSYSGWWQPQRNHRSNDQVSVHVQLSASERSNCGAAIVNGVRRNLSSAGTVVLTGSLPMSWTLLPSPSRGNH